MDATESISGLFLFGWAGLALAAVTRFAGKEQAGSATGLTFTLGWAGVLVGVPFLGYLISTVGYSAAWRV